MRRFSRADERGRTGAIIAVLLAAAAIALEVSLWLPWHNAFPGYHGHGDNITSIFGSVDREGAFLSLLGPRSGWSAVPVPSVLLAVLGVAALVLITSRFSSHPVPARLGWVISAGAAAGAVYCVVNLLLSDHSEADYVLRGYGATSYSGVFVSHRHEHGIGVSLALGACVILMISSARAAADPATRPLSAAV